MSKGKQQRAVSIIDGKMEIITFTGNDTYSVLKSVIPDSIQTFARMQVGRNRFVDFWCLDDFHGYTPNVAIIHPYPNIIYGPICILASIPPESYGLTDNEINKIKLIQQPGEPIPSLLYEGFERPAPPVVIPPGIFDFVIELPDPRSPEQIIEDLKRKQEGK